MNIVDCEQQLHKLLKLYDHIYSHHQEVSNILNRIESPMFERTKEIFNIIYNMDKKMPYDFKRNHSEYFDTISFHWLFEYKDKLICLNDCNLFEFPGIDTLINRINEIMFKTPIEAINYTFNALLTNIPIYSNMNDDNSKEFIDQVFQACMKYRSAALDYMNSLKLPTQSDWEIEN